MARYVLRRTTSEREDSKNKDDLSTNSEEKVLDMLTNVMIIENAGGSLLLEASPEAMKEIAKDLDGWSVHEEADYSAPWSKSTRYD
ncbi:hypothetical protein [Paracoccus sp. T5]|uniref:hypothetical protein n=1 Tax=Paracoccus sp. T5 TaxID=3402161 RepID=UPI003AE7D9E7